MYLPGEVYLEKVWLIADCVTVWLVRADCDASDCSSKRAIRMLHNHLLILIFLYDRNRIFKLKHNKTLQMWAKKCTQIIECTI